MLFKAGLTAGADASTTLRLGSMTIIMSRLQSWDRWLCVPVVAETYGAWGTKAMDISILAKHLAMTLRQPKSVVL